MSAKSKRAEAPFGIPDVVWEHFTGKLDENAIIGGAADGEPIYIGRVYFENELIIGSVILSRGVCIYLRNGIVSESSEFEVMVTSRKESLEWERIDEKSNVSRRTILQAGRQRDGDVFYIARIQEGGNTYIGSADANKKIAYIAQNGEQKIVTEFEILIHKDLEFFCICPPCPDSCTRKQTD